MTEKELKSRLVFIKKNNINITKVEIHELVPNMLKYIGALDEELRDHLIYSSFCDFIFNKNCIENVYLLEILEIIISDEFLLDGLGNKEDDSVFKRAFSVLVVAQIIETDNLNNFLTSDIILKVKDKLLVYLKHEKDLRGYVIGKGWAHSIAHCSDAINEIVKSNKLELNLCNEILAAIFEKIFIDFYKYHNDEDERLIKPILSMLKKGFPKEILITYIEEIPKLLIDKKNNIEKANYYILHANVKLFFKSLYFMTKGHKELSEIHNCVEILINKIYYK